MRWRDAVLAFAVLTFVLVGCGKNDPVVPYGGNAPIQAPPPPNYNVPSGGGVGGYPGGYPGGGYPGGGYPGGGFGPYQQYFPQQPLGNFRPQMPPGRPPQYYPFMPIENYMRQDPRLQQYWQGMWQHWQGYAGRHQLNPYDFSAFWFEYCPQQWNWGGWSDMYQYFDSNFYYWTQPGMQFGMGSDFSAEFFWSNADYFPMPQYDVCDYGCSYW